ncbi:MAG: hypothetical protein HY870_18365 [Chloroflexi bacterium]|nr:hypothetical protein [Chloroflexota bacterium]
MIDNERQVKELMQDMQAHLPLPALATDRLVQTLKRQLPELKRQRQLAIKSVLYMGDEGGIMCDISADGSTEAFICSLTHIEMPAEHPLAAKIQAYQQARIRKLAALGSGKPQRFTLKRR